ncbi:MAG: ATP-binding cassette domain-containing protein [Desulfobacteraceae bacterium]|nr:MAG: ATP-binding cassette domain-containing protein [Desulfobacteraceae bacterium]
MKEPFIQLENVSKRLGNSQILSDTRLDIYRGEITTIIGKSGVGKSVLLKHIIGLMEPDSGCVRFQGRPLSAMKKPERKALRRKISYMFQGNALFDSMTVYENIALPLKERTQMSDLEIREKVKEQLRRLDIRQIEDNYPSQISGGMKKRVALARALVTGPEVVLFDEPTTGLDPIRKSAVHHLISDFQRKFGFTGVIVSHEIPDIFYISQRIAMLNEGRIQFEGTPEEIQRVSDPVVQEFVQGLESTRGELTGMSALPLVQRRYGEGLSWLTRRALPFSIIILRLENLDEITAAAGHTLGLTLLINFADQVENRLRITDTCIRHGFNTVMLMLPDTNIGQARMICSKLAENITGRDIIQSTPYDGFKIEVGAGIIEVEENSEFERLIADAASAKTLHFEFRHD